MDEYSLSDKNRDGMMPSTSQHLCTLSVIIVAMTFIACLALHEHARFGVWLAILGDLKYLVIPKVGVL